ncbi:MAG: porin family protein [Gammaproteobacteria bacterium]|nr:porin family protein [Gammaproteobacteria bacterium]
MRLQQMIVGMMLLISFGISQAGEARHYFGISNESYDIEGLSAISYRYGYDVGNVVSFEIDYSQTDFAAPTSTISTLDSATNLMLNFNHRYESVNIYLALGYGSVAMTQPGLIYRDGFNGPAYGVGIELYGSKDTAISFSWLRRLASQEDPAIPQAEVDSVRVGIVHHFDFANTISRY